MESITLIKSALRLTRKISARRKRKGTSKQEKQSNRQTKKQSFANRATLVVAIFFGICLVAAMASSASGSSTHSTTQSNLPANAQANIRSYAAATELGEKEITLQNSASAALTSFPNNSVNSLSSATVDQKTGKISYTRYTGSGGVLETAISNDSCPQPDLLKILKYWPITGTIISIIVQNKECANLNTDMLTSTSNGWLFTIPPALTTNCTPIQTILGAVQFAAWLALAPIIMLLGFSIMTRWGSASYADVLQSLPNLLLAVVGIGLCWFIVGQIVGFGNTLMQGFWSEFAQSNIGINIGDINDFVMPASLWEEWLVILFLELFGMLVLQALAPAAILGNVYGSFIVLAIDAVIGGSLIGDAPHYVILGFSMALGAEIVVRIILIDFYIILSPLVMLAFVIPGQAGVSFARDWIYGFLSLIGSQIAQVLVLGVGMLVLAEYQTMGPSDIVVDIIKFATLGLMIRIPSLFKSNAVDLIKQVGPMVASGVQSERTILQ